MAVIINGDTGLTTPNGVFTDSNGFVGIGTTTPAYRLDIQNPDTTSGADTYIRLKSNSVSGDGDAQIYIDASDTGEAGIVFQAGGVVTSYLQVLNGDDYVQLSNEVTSADLYLMSGVTAINDGYALRYARDGGQAVISGVTGTITSSALITTITGLSTTAGLYKGMFLTKTAGTGAFGVNATIKYIDVGANTITVESSAAMTAGSITFTATPNPTTIHIYSLSGGTWTTDADFARLAFGNADTSGAGDGGIKASINAYSYDTAGTGAGLDFYVSSNGTTLTKALRMTQTGEVYIAGTTDQGAYNLQCNGTGVWGAGAYVNGSDSRLKEEVQDLAPALDVVKAMRPVTYRYKETHSKDQSTQPGFIAQELQTAMAGQNYLDGVVQSGPEYLNVAYQNIIPLLTKAIQEQQVMIDELKVKVAALEAR